jgi:hypothetical protein
MGRVTTNAVIVAAGLTVCRSVSVAQSAPTLDISVGRYPPSLAMRWIGRVASHGDSAIGRGPVRSIVRWRDGFAVTRFDANSGVMEVDDRGRFRRWLFRPEPSHLQAFALVAQWRADSILVVDGVGRRALLMHPDAPREIRSFKFDPSGLHALTGLGSAGFVASATASSREAVGFGLHQFSDSGVWVRSFGGESRTYGPGDGTALLRSIALDQDARLWTGDYRGLRISALAVDGEEDQVYRLRILGAEPPSVATDHGITALAIEPTSVLVAYSLAASSWTRICAGLGLDVVDVPDSSHKSSIHPVRSVLVEFARRSGRVIAAACVDGGVSNLLPGRLALVQIAGADGRWHAMLGVIDRAMAPRMNPSGGHH